MIRDDVRAGLTNIAAVACTIFGEARGESILGQMAVGCVIRNRVRNARVARTYAAVATAPWQFSCWFETSPNADLVYTVATALSADVMPSLEIADLAMLAQAQWISDGIVHDDLHEDVSGGATHYLEKTRFETQPPKWAVGQQITATIGRHVFLRVVNP